MSTFVAKIIPFVAIVCFITLLCGSNSIASPTDWHVMVGDPNWYGDFDAAGYSDWIYYGYSQNHPYDYHELLSGEWGAAVYYDGIANDQTMWLTNYFQYPYWTTNSTFVVQGTPSSWDNTNNPTLSNSNQVENHNYSSCTAYDTGQSVIKSGDNKLQVTVDYEIAKLTDGSPMALRDLSGNMKYVKSEKSVLLQTYTVKNVSANSLTNVKFFQFLHSHGADDYGATLSSTYQTAAYSDPLSQYTPYNPVHTIGNFCYDITQWNDPNNPLHSSSTPAHADWMGFSSTMQPNYVENGTYAGHGSSEPTTGVNKSIEACNATVNLNNDANIYNDEAAGAMQWNLGTIAANSQKRITVALMWGHGTPVSCPLTLTKTDDKSPGQSVVSGDNITYTLAYENPQALSTLTITDVLPTGLDFVSATVGGTYNSSNRTVTWSLASPGTSGSVTLTVKVNDYAPMSSNIANTATINANGSTISSNTETTPTSYWTAMIMRTQVTYATIQAAINAAVTGDTIRIALGMHTENLNFGTKSLTLTSRDPNNASIVAATIINGLTGTTISISNPSNPADYSYIHGVHVANGQYGVTLSNAKLRAQKSLFTGATEQAIGSSNNSTLIATDCNFTGNYFAIYAANSYVAVDRSKFTGNGIGISASGNTVNVTNTQIINSSSGGFIASANATVNVNNSLIDTTTGHGVYLNSTFTTFANNIVRKSTADGIYCTGLNAGVFRNNVIVQNGIGSSGRYGIELINCRAQLIINNTIVGNLGSVRREYRSADPNIINCILRNNTYDLSGTFSHIRYCCLSTNSYPNNNNINSDPCFVAPDANNYHLKLGSYCIEAGDAARSYTGQTDIDGQPRRGGSRVDIGADEYYAATDFNGSGITNFNDFAILANAFMASPAEPQYNAFCDLAGGTTIDYNDLGVFMTNWLAKASWYTGPVQGLSLGFNALNNNIMMCNAQQSQSTSVEPDSDLTIAVYSEIPLSSMNLALQIDGDANFVAAMNAGDCNEYGWLPSEWTVCDIDPNGKRVTLGEIAANGAFGTVGYITLHYNSGAAAISVIDNATYDVNNQPVLFGTEPLVIESEPNEPNEPNEPAPAIYLACENTAPDANSDVTVYVYSEVPLTSIGLSIELSGDASITGAMNNSDCSQYGWNPGWWTSSEIDPNGLWAYIGACAGEPTQTGNVGYFTIHYNSGEVSIAICDYSDASDANTEPVAISTDPLILGGSQQQMMMGGMARSEAWPCENQPSQQPVDVNSLVNWLEDLWDTEPDIRAGMTETQWQEFLDAVRNGQ